MTCWIYKTRTKHILTYAISYHLRPAHTPEWFVYIHVCTCMCLCACVWIYPPTLIHSCCSYFKFYSTKWPELSNFLFLPKKHLPLGSSQSNDNALKWLWSAEYRCHSHQATPLRSGRTGQKSDMFLFFWNAPRLEGKLLSSYFLSEEMPFQSFYIQHAFLIGGKMSQSKLIWLLDFVQYKQIVSIPLNLFCFKWATKSKFNISY